MVVVSLKGVSTGFEVLPAQDYTLVLHEYKVEAASRNSGKPAFRLQMRVVEPEEYKGRMVFDNGTLQSHALFGFKRAIKALGAPDDVLEGENMTAEEILKNLRDEANEVVAGITVEEYGPPERRRKQNRIIWYVEDDEHAAGGEDTGW